MNQDDLDYMRLAIQEAEKGKGRTSPNPCVGAVIVKDNAVVGRGYHKKAGTPHAEINAISDAGKDAAESTIYVTLEPCNHTGKTPPCTKAILDAGLKRVVVGMCDPNPTVAGGGNAYLQSQGVEVEFGLLEEECIALNRPFIKHITTGLPWVVMKAGMSLDGKITYVPGQGGRITGNESKHVTHELRNTLDAILVGVETAVIDEPSLTTRLSDVKDVRDPLRVVLDSRLRLPPQSKMLHQMSDAETWIYCGSEAAEESKRLLADAGAIVHTVGSATDGRLDIMEVLKHMGANDITSVLVEGGAAVHGYMLNHSLVDEVYLFTAPIFIGENGLSLLSGYSDNSPEACSRLNTMDCRLLGSDLLVHGFFENKQ